MWFQPLTHLSVVFLKKECKYKIYIEKYARVAEINFWKILANKWAFRVKQKQFRFSTRKFIARFQTIAQIIVATK